MPLIPRIGEPSPSSVSNGIYTHRLKNKIGTHMVPTAELSLKSTTAYLLGSLDHSVRVRNILPVLYITRIHSAISGETCHLGKCLEIATAYSKVRRISGGKQLLAENAVHVAQLAPINLVYRALTRLVLGTISFIGKVETNVASEDDEPLLRILTAVTKAFTAEKAVSSMEESTTTLGGMSYMEEVGIGSDQTTFMAFENRGTKIFDSCPLELVRQLSAPLAVKAAFRTIDNIYGHPMRTSPLLPRPGLMLVGYAASAAMLLEHAVWSHNLKTPDRDVYAEVFASWVNEGGLTSLFREVLEIAAGHNGERISMNCALVYGPSSSRGL